MRTKADQVKLTDQQQAVVNHDHGPALVFAVAGAGKTTAMVHRIKRLVGEGVHGPERILATSFGRSNVIDLQESLKRWPACNQVKPRTLHSLGLGIIRQAQKLGFLRTLKLNQDAGDGLSSVNQSILNQTLAQARQRQLPFVRELDGMDRGDFLDYVGSCKSRLQYPDLEAVKLPQAARCKARQAKKPIGLLSWYLELYGLFENVRQQKGLIAYDDMLMSGWETLVTYPEVLEAVRGSYDCILVDEFQDINKAQSEILDLLSEPHRNYMAIGDDDQTIYEWRGASPDFILNFQKRYGASSYVIADNFRCPAGPLVLANEVIAHNTRRSDKQLSLTQGFGGEARLQLDADVTEMARRIVSKIQQLHRKGRAYNDMAILVRINAQNPPIEQSLIAAKIPYRVSNPFYERPEIATLIHYCRLAWIEKKLRTGAAVLNQRNGRDRLEKAWINICNRPKRYISNQVRDEISRTILQGSLSPVKAFRRVANSTEVDWLRMNLEKLAADVEWLSARLDRAPDKVLTVFESRLQYKKFLRESVRFSDMGEGLAASVTAFIEYAQGHETLLSFLMHIRELADSKAGKETSSRVQAVTVSTIHRAKGLEWPVVFIPQCNQGIVPFGRGNGQSNLEEERRLLYVALTRTRQDLYLHALTNEPISEFLSQANWRKVLRTVSDLKKVLAKNPDGWRATDALTMARQIPALGLERYFRLWWTALESEKQETAWTMQRFHLAINRHDLQTDLSIDPKGVELWRSISPLPAGEPVEAFPGLEPYLGRYRQRQAVTRRRAGERPKPARSSKRVHYEVKPAGVGRQEPEKDQSRPDSLSERMKRLRSLDNVATDEAIRELAETLGDPRGALRYLAGTALRRIGGRQVVEKLARTLEKGEPSPTLMEEGKKVLVVMAETDPDSSARQHASALLSRLLRLEQPGPKSGEEENR